MPKNSTVEKKRVDSTKTLRIRVENAKKRVSTSQNADYQYHQKVERNRIQEELTSNTQFALLKKNMLS